MGYSQLTPAVIELLISELRRARRSRSRLASLGLPLSVNSVIQALEVRVATL